MRLTARELEVLRFIAWGTRNAEIADQLGISINTVESHARRLFEKLGVHSRLQASRRAVALGLLGDPGAAVMEERTPAALLLSGLTLVSAYGGLLLEVASLPDALRRLAAETVERSWQLARLLEHS